MNQEEILYSIALRRCKNIGDIHFYKLISHFGSAKTIWQINKKDLTETSGLSYKITQDIGNTAHLDFANQELEFCSKNNITPLLRHLGELPGWLGECEDAPAILYSKGSLPKNGAKFISIVGTRNTTNYGKQFIGDLLKQLPNTNNIYTVSGLALGIDTEAHLQSLNNNIPTIAVLAHGFHTLYPAKNRALSEKIVEQNGLLLTEFNSSQKPDKEHFIQRNRVIAGISASTIVVETAFGGGSISTANFANGYNRDVFALPGKYTDKYSQGCNMLIAQNKAKAIYNFNELILDLGIAKKTEKIGKLFPEKDISMLTDLQQKIYHIIKNKQKITADDLSLEMDISAHEIISELLQLEIFGLIQCNSSRQYSVL